MNGVKCEMFETLLVEPRHAFASQVKSEMVPLVKKGLAPFYLARIIGDW